MRLVEQIPEELERTINRTAQRDAALSQWLVAELEDAYASRVQLDQDWQEDLRQYEGVPKNPARSIPFENAPNIEITLGAIACDALYAQTVDLIWSVVPTVTVRPARTRDASLMENRVKDAEALQDWIDWGVKHEWGLRKAADHAYLDNIQLGTGIFYVPWIMSTKKTDIYQVLDVGPRVFPVPTEDFLVPGGSFADVQTVRWCAMRVWMTQGEVNERARKLGWDTKGMQAVGTVGWTRSRREMIGGTRSSAKVKELYEVHEIHAYYDYDEDGLDEDLLITWDRHGHKILKLRYNPFDGRPFEVMRYQTRAHLFNGLGVMRMIRPYQEEVTETHADILANSKLANMRMFKGRPNVSSSGTISIWHGRYFDTAEPDKDFIPIQLADVYPSSYRNESVMVAFAERRVGSAEIASPRPSQLLGGRTPGITALSVLQQANRRFTPAFDGMRFATAGAAIQCVYRYRERLLAGDASAAQNIVRVLGNEAGNRVIRLLMSEHFEDDVDVELTASSVSVNREADKQNALMLAGVIGSYYERALTFMQLAENQGLSEATRSVARQIAEKTGELIERTIKTFDSVRDPQTFVLQLEREIDSLPASQEGLEGLVQAISAIGSEQSNGGLPTTLQ